MKHLFAFYFVILHHLILTNIVVRISVFFLMTYVPLHELEYSLVPSALILGIFLEKNNSLVLQTYG